MLLYIYDIDTGSLRDTIEAVSYDGDRVSSADCTVLLGPNQELSSLPDLSEALCADWRRRNPTLEDLVNILLGVAE